MRGICIPEAWIQPTLLAFCLLRLSLDSVSPSELRLGFAGLFACFGEEGLLFLKRGENVVALVPSLPPPLASNTAPGTY